MCVRVPAISEPTSLKEKCLVFSSRLRFLGNSNMCSSMA